MNVELKLCGYESAHIMANLWALYCHDLSEFDGTRPNRHGVLIEEDSAKSLGAYATGLVNWWKDPEALFPYLIYADGRPVGFNLVASRSRLPDEIDADFVVHEFFVMHAVRGKAVAEQATVKGFELHRGRWQIVTYPNHARAIAFWKRVIHRYSNGQYSVEEMDHPWGRKVAFTFVNTQGELAPSDPVPGV